MKGLKKRFKAVTREVSATLGECELTHLPRVAIDVARARAQHAGYCKALSALGCDVLKLPAMEDMPDAVFVEDTAVVVDEVAVITRLGAASRRGEAASVAETLRQHRRLLVIEPPGMVEGGDVLQVGRTLYVGRSSRTNASGIRQLSALLAPHGHRVLAVEMRGCLHLKTAVTQVAADMLLINPCWVNPGDFGSVSFVEVDSREPFGGNALLIGATAVYPDSFPRTRELLERHGISIEVVDISELQKAEAGVTCCSLVFRETPAVGA